MDLTQMEKYIPDATSLLGGGVDAIVDEAWYVRQRLHSGPGIFKEDVPVSDIGGRLFVSGHPYDALDPYDTLNILYRQGIYEGHAAIEKQDISGLLKMFDVLDPNKHPTPTRTPIGDKLEFRLFCLGALVGIRMSPKYEN